MDVSEDNSSCDDRISVSIQILSKIPALPHIFRKRKSSFKYDEHATIFVRRSHGLGDASLCELTVGSKGAPAILRVLDDEDSNLLELDETETVHDEAIPHVYVPPCIAATLGLHWFRTRYNKFTTATLRVQITSSVNEALHATVVEIGVPPPNPCFQSFHDGNRQQAQSSPNENDSSGLKKFFMHPKICLNSNSSVSKNLKSKPRQRLLTLGSIFAASCEDGTIKFYKVTNIQPVLHVNESSKSIGAYFVSPSTHLTLAQSSSDESSIPGCAIRLPRPSLVASFLKSIKDASICSSGDQAGSGNNDEQTSTSTNQINAETIRHPSAQQVADALYLLGLSTESYKSCCICQQSHFLHVSKTPRIIHVIGGEENHVSSCVAEAADIMGMRYFCIDGLASFWAHFSVLCSYSRQSDEKNIRSLTGQLLDKLNGLSAAMEIAHQSSPCVLHVVGIDEELSPVSGHGADADSRREEEQRILQVIQETMLRLSSRKLDVSSLPCANQKARNEITSLSDPIAPQVIVVLSSSKTLIPGPLTSSLEQNSINLSPPNAQYARYLWDNDVDGTFHAASPRLAELSARDIVLLRQKFIPRWKAEEEKNNLSGDTEQLTSAIVALVDSLLSELQTMNDMTQQCQGSGSSSTVPLSSTTLPDVRWEDIGGLASVRKEIMDAVELPLKYPELFEGSRRSGILLFGPPGTGKTLVAKAVARECGLPFLSIKGPELLGSYVGESEANVRAVFEAARSAASSATKPHSSDSGFKSDRNAYGGASVLFFDELDSLAPRRGETGHGDGVMERVVATLLSELDNRGSGGGADSSSSTLSNSNDPQPHVIVIGATNRPDLLDPSLLRPGRFDRLLYLGPAKTKQACLQILIAQTRKFEFQDGCDRAEVLAGAMESFPPNLSGADLSAVASEALMHALKRVCDNVEKEVQAINLSRGVDENSDDAVDANDVMESWTDEQLQPIVLAEDFVRAAAGIVPSISEDDLKRFEVLRNQFSAVV